MGWGVHPFSRIRSDKLQPDSQSVHIQRLKAYYTWCKMFVLDLTLNNLVREAIKPTLVRRPVDFYKNNPYWLWRKLASPPMVTAIQKNKHRSKDLGCSRAMTREVPPVERPDPKIFVSPHYDVPKYLIGNHGRLSKTANSL